MNLLIHQEIVKNYCINGNQRRTLNTIGQIPSRNVVRGGGCCTVQTWFVVFTDGTDETREYEEELNDTSAPATDVLSEVTGRERNKEEILDAVRPYKSQDDDKFVIQDGSRPGG